MSKGSKPRPVDREAYNDNFDKIFGPPVYKSIKQEDEEDYGDTDPNPNYHSKSEQRRKETPKD